MTERQDLVSIIHAARVAGRFDYARAAAVDWLASWPGDLEIAFLLAQAEVEQGLNQPASARLVAAITADPEFTEAYDLLASAFRASSNPVQAQVFGACAGALRAEDLDPARSPSWALPLSRAIRARTAADWAASLAESQQALTGDPALPLPTLVAVQAHLGLGERDSALGLARLGHDRWPECLHFRILLADEFLAKGQSSRGVDYLHRAAADDPTGRVAIRLLGPDHPYRSLWPAQMAASLSQPIPAEVAAVLGSNRLSGASATPGETQPSKEEPQRSSPSERRAARVSRLSASAVADASQANDDSLPSPEPGEAFRGPNAGNPASHSATPEDAETLVQIRNEFDKVAARLKVPRRRQDEDLRVPAYVAVSCRTRLVQEFGEDGALRIDEAIMGLVEAVRRRPGWTAYRLYLDDPNSLQPFGLSPADPQNAWQLKLRLADLDNALGQRGEMIGALFIIGGDRVLPFHMLPNPTDDEDDAVPSDNPYATTDENYFAPEWPVGRLPIDADPDLLVSLVRSATEEHRLFSQSLGPIQRLRSWLARRLRSVVGRQAPSLGYTANIWRKASLAVFRLIGDPASMITSPPVEAGTLPAQATRPVRLSYFNLHGVEDSPEWFGQRDPFEDPEASAEYPVALRPQDVVDSGRAPRVVYTEACYGANALGKSRDTALCLKFLASGSRAVVGSTKTSYGSITPPLIAADLLGRTFWEHLNRSFPSGEALRRAKLGLAAEMHRRQGFLDGEDQKTLIAFILYGDPLYSPAAPAARQNGKAVIRRTTRPTGMKTTCALGGPDLTTETLDPATLERVKSIVSRYLPGMADAQCRIHNQHCGCESDDHLCPSHQLGIKAARSLEAETLVVTFSKQIADGPRQHARFARLTLGPSGKVLKLAVSR